MNSGIDYVDPQSGFQDKYLGSPADVVFGGGSAGCGKTWCVIVDPLRYTENPKFGHVTFRKTYPEITQEGGLWDESKEIYPRFGAIANEGKLRWKFPSGARISFEHLSHERELGNYQGAQMAGIAFDEVTHFSKKMFIYMFSRNRSTSGIRPYIKCTCNPDPDSWVADFLSWWIDQDTGFPIQKRSGKIRYFTVDQSNFVWGNTREEVLAKCPHLFSQEEIDDYGLEQLIKSCTFIPGLIYENKILLKRDPGYLGNLKAQEEEEKLRLLEGNWKIRTDAAALFKWASLEDMFTNVIPDKAEPYYITIDHARDGQDLCVIGTWKGWRLLRIDVLTKSHTADITEVVRQQRIRYRPLPASQIIVDQDGIGVADALNCKVFQGNSAAELKPISEIGIGRYKVDIPLFQNFKSQVAYTTAEKVNASAVWIDLENTYVNGIRTRFVKQKGKEYEIKTRIKEDLRPLKREKKDYLGKIQITSKEVQKNALGGLSPDFGDMIIMRGAFEFIRQQQYMKTH